MAIWLALGSLGWLLAAWQLRPAYLRYLGGGRAARALRRRPIPPVGKRPMLWKELFIERTNTLGLFGRWASALLIVALVAGSVFVAVAQLGRFSIGLHPTLVTLADTTSVWLAVSATYLAWFIEWSIGLRASGVVAAERQRHTWDTLLTTPLSGTEIVLAKTWGSLYALRWLLGVTILAWTVAVFSGALPPLEYANLVAMLLASGFFMAAVGVAVSLASSNPTRGMATTIGLWLAAAIGTAIVAALLSLVFYLALLLAWTTWELLRARVTSFVQASLVRPWRVFSPSPIRSSGWPFICLLGRPSRGYWDCVLIGWQGARGDPADSARIDAVAAATPRGGPAEMAARPSSSAARMNSGDSIPSDNRIVPPVMPSAAARCVSLQA